MSQHLPNALRPLALSLHLAFLGAACAAGLALPGAVRAEEAAAFDFAIPAGPLQAALADFSSQTHVNVSYAPEILGAGKRSTGVQGRLTAARALTRLLAGSGLIAVRQGNGFTLEKAPERTSAGDTTLAPMTVTATAERSGTTEGTGSYTTRITTTATKLALSPRETPQTVTVVTRQKMDDFGLASVDDVLESISGSYVRRSGGDGNMAYSRGFAMQTQYDGIPNPIGIGENNRGPSPDTAFLDKVEILQGASGLMSGAGEPGGTINLVRKRPTEQFQAHVEAQLGSWNKKRLVGDVSGSLIDSGRIRGRAVALVDHSDSFTDYVFDNKQGFYGIVEADLTSTTTVSASVMHQENDFNMHYGVPRNPNGANLRLPRSGFYGLADGDGTKKSASYTLNLEQKLPADWLLKAAYSHVDVAGDTVLNNLGFTLDVATGSGLRLATGLIEREFKSNVFDVYFGGPFHLLGRKHELIFGAVGAQMDEKSRTYSISWNPISNIYDFDPKSIFRPSGPPPAWNAPNETKQDAFYSAARLNLAESLKLILGTRVSWYEYKAAGVRKQKEDAVVSPYAGLVYDLDKSTSIYASYSDIFKPQSSLTFGGGTVDPVVGENYEMGVKGEFLQGRLNASAAAFRLEQTNLAQIDYDVGTACNGGYCYKAAGLVVSQGVDLGLNGEVFPGWQVGAGYTYAHSKTEEGENQGQAYGTNIPQHVFRAHTTYLIPGTDWAVGGNIRSQSGMYSESTGYRAEQGGYTVVGLMAKYRIGKQTEVGMTVNNLFDRRYYENIGSKNLGNFYGSPRSFAVNLKYTF